MAFYSEDTFQMDEELPSNTTSTSSQSLAIPDGNVATPITTIEYASPKMVNKGYNNKIIQKKLMQYKEEVTTTEDEELKFDEDLDDKLDESLQKKMELYNLDLLTPPENFAPIINTIYRSSFPQPNNFAYLKTLNLKSILCLIPEDYPLLQLQFLKQENIQLFQLGMSGNKEPFVKISLELITEAAKIVLKPANHPILIHCNRGKHRTGCLVGVIRRLQNWSLTLIFDEYRKFAAPKERPMDLQFIELYEDEEIVKYAQELDILPLKWDVEW